MEASPDVVHPTRRLGRRAPKNHVALDLADFVSAPSHPAAADHFSQIRDWGLYNNDRVGICGPTSVANSRKLVTLYATGTEVSPTQHDTDDLYRRSGNPGFTGDPSNPGEDNGVDMQTMCEALLADGIGGVKPLGFAKVDVRDLGLLDAAVDLFGFLLLGVNLLVPQQTQRMWDYTPGDEWGGHAVLYGRYAEAPEAAAERRGLVSWAEVLDMTDLFVEHQLDEAWAVIWPEVWDHPVFDQNFDKVSFARAWEDITDKQWPGPVPPPSPAPSPPPAPASSSVLEVNLDADVLARIHHVAAGDIDRWMNHHFRSYFKMH